ncbi:MAG: Uma2 family endonuclease [Dehalococcoidia bacterium]|nr:Uma2 family endonuclease [Dehalococcoidia bacterium]
MAQPKPRLKFTVDDYMATPEGTRYQLLDGELIVAPAPNSRHQTVSRDVFIALHQFISVHRLGEVWYAPFDVVLSEHDVTQPDILFVSYDRANIITPANIQGAPELVVEVLSPSTQQDDRGYKRRVYGRHGVREYWIVDPVGETIEVLTRSGRGLGLRATYRRGETLASPLLAGLSLDLNQIFG